MDVTQGKLAMGFRTGGIDLLGARTTPPWLMCNAVFGGTTTVQAVSERAGEAVPVLLCQLHAGEDEGADAGVLRHRV